MSLADKITADAALFLSPARFGEWVTYWPRTGVAGRRIAANVVRDSGAKDPGRPELVTPRTEVDVANDATAGISAEELDCGGDRLEVAVSAGGAVTQRYAIRRRGGPGGQQDAGLLKLELR